jgi:hypothetical protein
MDNEEIRIEELRVGNIVYNVTTGDEQTQSIIKVHENHFLKTAGGNYLYENFEPLPLTKEILKNNLGFEVTDMGDFWQAEKEDFVLIQIKLSIGSMPFMFVLKSSIKESVNFYYVHHLQNTYLDLKGELLLWKSK